MKTYEIKYVLTDPQPHEVAALFADTDVLIHSVEYNTELLDTTGPTKIYRNVEKIVFSRLHTYNENNYRFSLRFLEKWMRSKSDD